MKRKKPSSLSSLKIRIMESSLRYPFLFLILITLLSNNCVSSAAKYFNIPRLGAHRRRTDYQTEVETMADSDHHQSDGFRTFFFTQTLDHFSYKPESYTTFQQKYVINSKYWAGSNSTAPIFMYLGAEGPLDEDLGVIGFLPDNAPRFKALLVYIEHRYYGESIPFGSRKEAMKNASTLGYFNSAQALADYAAVMLHVKRKYSAEMSPVIAIGGSYGGMLAAWFRLKYPHIAMGALASSAPILYFHDIAPRVGYYTIVTKDFKEASESCYDTVRKSWGKIKKVAASPNGLSILSQRFRTCKPLKKRQELEDYLDTMYAEAAQYNDPPKYPLNGLCGAVDGAAEGNDVLGKIFAGVEAYKGKNSSCYDIAEYSKPTETSEGWLWQTCSEMVMPIGHGNDDTMFPPAPFDLNRFTKGCEAIYGVKPKPFWVTTYYGGRDLKLIIHRFGSNIIFSNGLRDPYSSGGVLENISDSVVAITTVNGSHCLDILGESKSDPQWLVMQRKAEINIIEGWIAKYRIDLLAYKDQS